MDTTAKRDEKVFIRHYPNVVVFYKLVRETEKSVWLQRIGKNVKSSTQNDGHRWEVEPDVTALEGDVFRKMKTLDGRIKMDKYTFLHDYDKTRPVFETIF